MNCPQDLVVIKLGFQKFVVGELTSVHLNISRCQLPLN